MNKRIYLVITIILITMTGIAMAVEKSSIIPENRSIYLLLKSNYRFAKGYKDITVERY